MASSAVLPLLLLIAVAATVRGYPAQGTPASRFWEAALPGSPMPEAIADLVQKGADHSPLKEHHSVAVMPMLSEICLGYRYRGCRLPARRDAASSAEGIFFHQTDVREGSAMTVALPASSPAAFLPRDAADSIPFGNLTDALARFGIAPGSQDAARVGDTVRGCREAPLVGERKVCATSLEGIVLSATHMLATSRPVAAAASALPSSGLPRSAYVVQAVRSLGCGGCTRFVACHARPYPYAVYECHMTTEGSTNGYVVSIRGSGLPTVDMVALCHLDTSNWSPDHPAFKILGTRPGGSPVCHFMPYADLVFSEKAPNNA